MTTNVNTQNRARFHKNGYHNLASVLSDAFDQAAFGKGHERHANGDTFDKQVIMDMASRFGIGAVLGQAFKKSEESQRLPYDKARAELLGSIVYLAAAVIHLDKQEKQAGAEPFHVGSAGLAGQATNAARPPVSSFAEAQRPFAAQGAGAIMGGFGDANIGRKTCLRPAAAWPFGERDTKRAAEQRLGKPVAEPRSGKLADILSKQREMDEFIKMLQQAGFSVQVIPF